jgi:hypothetical protein
MEYIFFYCSIVIVWIIFLISVRIRKLHFGAVLTGLLGAGYSSIFESFLGEYLDLYYYIAPESSILYIVLSALFLYPIIEIVYVLFLPEKPMQTLLYTFLWLILMLAFEAASLKSGTIVLTGWRIVPWSFVTYIITFTWINIFYRYAKRKGL